MGKQLLVNGIGLAKLTPITKVMAHLPLVFLPQQPQGAGHLLRNGHDVSFSALLEDIIHHHG
jgi:hypothetical protein